MPSELNPGTTPAGQGTNPNSQPVYAVPQSSIQSAPQHAPVFVAQSSGQTADLPLPANLPTGSYLHTGNQVPHPHPCPRQIPRRQPPTSRQ